MELTIGILVIYILYKINSDHDLEKTKITQEAHRAYQNLHKQYCDLKTEHKELQGKYYKETRLLKDELIQAGVTKYSILESGNEGGLAGVLWEAMIYYERVFISNGPDDHSAAYDRKRLAEDSNYEPL